MTESRTAPRIWLTLLLQGGQRESLSVAADSPLLAQLRDSLVSTQGQPWRMQVPSREGAGTLTLDSSQIVGYITQPPLPMALPRNQSPVAPERGAQAEPPALLVEVADSGFADGSQPSRLARIENVLTAVQHKALIQYATRNRQMFSDSTTATGAARYRESLVCYNFPPFDDLIRHRVRLLLPKVARQLGISEPGEEIEIQLTTHNDGQYYRTHNDHSGEGLRHRRISFVYYFHRTPKRYSGGLLRVYDREVKDGILRAAATYKDIEPADNSLVFFDSRELHEVTTVSCPGKQFADGRFTINGWVGTKPA